MGMQQHFKGHWEVDNDGFTCYEEQGTKYSFHFRNNGTKNGSLCRRLVPIELHVLDQEYHATQLSLIATQVSQCGIIGDLVSP